MPRVADERTMLEAWLDWHRQTLLMKCTGLGAEQLKRRSVAPSTLTFTASSDIWRRWSATGSASALQGKTSATCTALMVSL
jgi:uncharacterized protein DUF664